MMARPSVIPGIKARLELWLDQCESAYLAQPEDIRQPTLPLCPDGKVNVRAVAQAIQLKSTQEKYLYEREELTQLINCIAEGQAGPSHSKVIMDESPAFSYGYRHPKPPACA
jgi:hypothetical protein